MIASHGLFAFSGLKSRLLRTIMKLIKMGKNEYSKQVKPHFLVNKQPRNTQFRVSMDLLGIKKADLSGRLRLIKS